MSRREREGISKIERERNGKREKRRAKEKERELGWEGRKRDEK